MNFGTPYHHEMRRPVVGYESLDGKLSTISFRQAPLGYERYDTQIEATDVLCGRGKTSFNHVGNRRFRDLIAASTDKYNNAKSRLEKSMVVHYIVEEVKKVKGRFLKQDRYSGKWYELDERQAKEKVGHAIRDATSSIDPKKKTLKKTRSKSSTSPSTSKDITVEKELSDSGISLNALTTTTTTTTSKARTTAPWDDLEPLRVDSLEAQNSLTELQNDDLFLHRMSIVLDAQPGMEDSGHCRPFRFEVV